ncbi:MAG: M50 family metallopeptidase [Clostridia bacterium]|nr:M50 family metallopeptidase [Clostridia bacterium]
MIVLYIILAIILLMLMITIHELGHYIAGKLLKFRINEFSVGFGKVLWQKVNERGEKVSLRLLPLGGYCAFYGEDGSENEEKDKKQKKDNNATKDEKIQENKVIVQKDGADSEVKKVNEEDYFTSKAPWKRIIVLSAGVIFNFLSAIIFSFILLVAFGYGNIYVVTDINPNFSQEYSENVGLNEIGKYDKILKIDGKNIDYIWESTLENLVEMKNGNTYTLTIQKNETNEIKDVEIFIQTNIVAEFDEEAGEYVNKTDDDGQLINLTGIGFSVAISSQPISFIDALSQCFTFTIGLVWLVMKSLWLLITFQLPLSSLGGTLTVISEVATKVQQSISALFIYLPLIAANLAVFNLLPFPALDGSRIVFTTIEWIRKRPINREIEAIIHFVGLIILFAFVILIDLIHFLG